MQTLTAEQRQQIEVNGYLHLPQVFEPEEVAFFSDEIDRIRKVPGFEPDPAQHLPIGHYSWIDGAKDQDPGGMMDRRDLLPYGKPFVDLIDREGIFDLIVDIMGPYVLFSMSQAIVRQAGSKFPGYTHTDGGEALREIRVTETSRPLAMKAMYFLSDVDQPDSGNLTVFPGSHMRPIPISTMDAPAVTPYSPGAAQIMARAGDCVLFSHALWHGPCRNDSSNSRKVLLYNYCQMFMRWYDFELVSKVAAQATPRQRRLLGDLGYDFMPGSYFYGPKDQADVMHQRS